VAASGAKRGGARGRAPRCRSATIAAASEHVRTRWVSGRCIGTVSSGFGERPCAPIKAARGARASASCPRGPVSSDCVFESNRRGLERTDSRRHRPQPVPIGASHDPRPERTQRSGGVRAFDSAFPQRFANIVGGACGRDGTRRVRAREGGAIRGAPAAVASCRFAASWDQPDGVFCRVMGPPLLQAEGTTRGGGVRSFSQPHGTSRFAGSWDPLRQVTSRAIGK